MSFPDVVISEHKPVVGEFEVGIKEQLHESVLDNLANDFF